MAAERKLMKNGSTAQEGGHTFQALIQTCLTDLQKSTRMRALRLYDTRSTNGGSILPEQDGDFIVQCTGHGWLIEAKASLKFESLGQSRSSLTEMMPEHQGAAQRLWVRSGGHGLVVFHHLDSSYVEFWRGDYVGEVRATPKEHLDHQFMFRCSAKRKDLQQTLRDVLTTPSKLFY